jgi:hypothetical protein
MLEGEVPALLKILQAVRQERGVTIMRQPVMVEVGRYLIGLFIIACGGSLGLSPSFRQQRPPRLT